MVWTGGVALLWLYALISYILLRKRVAVSQKICDRVYLCDDVQSPFILGVISPKIYLPSGMDEDVTDCVLEHERAHLKRGDQTTWLFNTGCVLVPALMLDCLHSFVQGYRACL